MFNTVVTIQALSQSIYARENLRVVWLYHMRSESRLDGKWLPVLLQSNLAKSWSKVTETYKKCKN